MKDLTSNFFTFCAFLLFAVATGLAQTPTLTVNNASGTGDIADFQVAGTNKVQLINTTAANSSVSASSPLLSLSGQYWNGASAPDSWTIQNSIGGGTNGLASLAFVHSGSTSAEVNFIGSKLIISGTGSLKKVGNISSIGALGVPVVEGVANLTAQSGAIGHTDLVASTLTEGSYTIHYYVDQRGFGSCSSATVSIVFNWTDGTTARSFATSNFTLSNTQGPSLFVQGNLNIWAALAADIYLTTNVGGSGFGTNCSYDVHAWVDQSQ